MTEQTTYLSKVSEVDGQLAIDFPKELFEQFDWKPGQLLVWAALPEDAGFVVTKVEM